jgi:hypothetical protein
MLASVLLASRLNLGHSVGEKITRLVILLRDQTTKSAQGLEGRVGLATEVV